MVGVFYRLGVSRVWLLWEGLQPIASERACPGPGTLATVVISALPFPTFLLLYPSLSSVWLRSSILLSERPIFPSSVSHQLFNLSTAFLKSPLRENLLSHFSKPADFFLLTYFLL